VSGPITAGAVAEALVALVAAVPEAAGQAVAGSK